MPVTIVDKKQATVSTGSVAGGGTTKVITGSAITVDEDCIVDLIFGFGDTTQSIGIGIIDSPAAEVTGYVTVSGDKITPTVRVTNYDSSTYSGTTVKFWIFLLRMDIA